MILNDQEVRWESPKTTEPGDIVFFVFSEDNQKRIASILEDLKKTKRYPDLGKHLKRALQDHAKYGGKIYAVGQVCEIPEEIDPADPFYTNAKDPRQLSDNYYCSITNIVTLEHPVDCGGSKIMAGPGKGSYILISGADFPVLRDMVADKNRDMKIPLYFLKSTARRNRPAEIRESTPVPEETPAAEQTESAPSTGEETPPVSPELSAGDTLSALLREAEIETIDKRANGGALWIIGGKELEPLVKRCKELGVNFTFKKGGGKVSGSRDAWWTKDPDPAD